MNLSSAADMLGLIIDAALLALVLFVIYDLVKNLSVKSIPDLPETDENPHLIHDLLLYLERPDLRARDGVTIDDDYVVNAVIPAKKVIDGRFDCQDFRMQTLLRLMYAHGDTLREVSPKGVQLIEDAFLHAKYWMTEPGKDSMCYWSENHQILYATAEYLAGQYWHDRVFKNDGATGREHMARGRERIDIWMRQRFQFGFAEFNSSNYYLFNVGPAANFIQFAAPGDSAMVTRMKMCLDLLLFDVALYMHKFSFIAPTGRAYVNNMVGETGDSVRKFTDYVWELRPGAMDVSHSMLTSFFAMLNSRDSGGNPFYEVPPVLRKIGLDASERILKASSGTDTSELPALGLVGHKSEQMMHQLGMEAFTNPEVIHNTITYFNKNDMLSNKFVNYFKIINLRLIRNRFVLSRISRLMNPMPNGIAIQRANLYCYQTKGYALSSVQRYHPGGFGAQQMLNVLNLGGRAVVFTAHPARHEGKNTVAAYPGYWAGFGRAPHSVQHKNVLMLIYKLPKRRGFLELYSVPQFTHTYLPEAYFDKVIVDGRYAFAQKDGTYLGINAARELDYLPYSEMSAKAFKNGLEEYPEKRFDLVQRGRNHYWIYELSDESRESFADFTARIRGNSVVYDGDGSLSCDSAGHKYKTVYGGAFTVDGVDIPLQHKRFDSPYCIAERGADEFIIRHAGHSLRLNYNNTERDYT
ncbi:MAG: hypothetical protein FWF05_02970 [Oscillospiraceae bacterium]|nr:hypothetical protein [Oscillospiraceae bacterium]